MIEITYENQKLIISSRNRPADSTAPLTITVAAVFFAIVFGWQKYIGFWVLMSAIVGVPAVHAALQFKVLKVIVDPEARGIIVKSTRWFRTSHQVFLFDEIREPIEIIDLRGLRMQATLIDGTLIELTEGLKASDTTAVIDATENLNEMVFGRYIRASVRTIEHE